MVTFAGGPLHEELTDVAAGRPPSLLNVAPAEVSTRGGAEPHRESPRVSIVVYSAQTRDANGTKHDLVATPGATPSL
jgi:hypothetical protein